MNTANTGPGRCSTWRRMWREERHVDKAWRTGYAYGRRDEAMVDAELAEMVGEPDTDPPHEVS